MTRAEFLAAPWPAVRAGDNDVPPEWIGDAWSQRPFRKRVVDEITRSVRLSGDFFAVSHLLTALGQASLRREAVVELYVAIRDGSERLEADWRGEFEDAFTEHVAWLPPTELDGSDS